VACPSVDVLVASRIRLFGLNAFTIKFEGALEKMFLLLVLIRVSNASFGLTDPQQRNRVL
jgi:hypothetical protein